MRTSAQLAKYGRLTGCPARDYPGSVDIRVLGVPTRQASECRLVGPVLLVGVPTFGTLPAGVPRVHGNQRNTRQLCLVDQERTQLGEGPTMQNGTLLTPSPDPLADAIEIFDGNAAPGAFGGFNDLLTDHVVDVFGKTKLLARQLLQPALGGAGLLLLQPRPQPAMPVSNALHFAAAVPLAVAGGSNLRNSEVYAKELANSRYLRLCDLARGHQKPFATDQAEIGFAFPGCEQCALPVATDKRNTQPAIEGPDGNGGGLQVVGEDSLIESGRSRGAEGAPRLLVEFVGIGYLRNAAHGGLRGKSELIPHTAIAELVQIELPEGFGIPRHRADRIASGIASGQRARQGVRLDGGRAEFQLRGEMHSGFLLGFDVPLNCRRGHRPGTADVIAPAPKRWQPRFQSGEFLPQFVGRIPLHLIGNVLWGVSGRSLQEQVDVVGHHFESDDLAVEFSRLRHNQSTQSSFHPANKNFPAIFRAPDEVIGQRRNTSAKVPVSLNAHKLIMRRYSIAGNEKAGSLPAKSTRRPMRSPRSTSAWLKPAVSRARIL